MKNLFTVPKGEKVTERNFKRVLISSVCGILLCMSCLMTTTWAWFTSTVEKNIGPIKVASHHATVYEGNTDTQKTDVILEAGATEAKELQAVFVTDADPSKDSFKDSVKPGRYIVMTVFVKPGALSEEQTDTDDYSEYYTTLCFAATMDGDGLWYVPLELTTGVDCKLVFESAWRIPAGRDVIAVALNDDKSAVPILMEVIPPVSVASATETTAASKPSTSVPATTEPKETEAKATETKGGESEKAENE